jgi:lipopolysaccharide transport system permease protein
MPLSIVVSNLVRFGITLLLLVMAMIYFTLFSDANFGLTWYVLVLPWLIILMAAQGLGLGMIVSSLTTKYRDLALLVTFGVQLLMYATTVVYPLSSLNGTMRMIISLNPMTGIIEGVRKGLLGSGTFDLSSLIYTTFVSFCLAFAGIVIFNKVERNFIDTI